MNKEYTKKILELAVDLLNDYNEMLSYKGCNDWEYPSNWTKEDIKLFGHDAWVANGSPTNEDDAERTVTMDFESVSTVAMLIKKLSHDMCADAYTRTDTAVDYTHTLKYPVKWLSEDFLDEKIVACDHKGTGLPGCNLCEGSDYRRGYVDGRSETDDEFRARIKLDLSSK